MPRLVYATRKSKLALAQSRAFVAELQRHHPELDVEELTVVTTGDMVQDRPLAEVGGKGLFVKEIEQSLAERRADVAVHSSKDVPAELAPGMVLGCFPRREDPRDVLVSRSGAKLAELPAGSRVGTTSQRRALQLKRRRPDLVVVPLRGNVDTRLRKCEEGVVDAILLARAGLVRLGLAERATEVLEANVCLPAIGQGALAVEHRADDEHAARLLAPLSHAETSVAVSAERGVMVAVEGDCQTPVAAYGVRSGDELWLRALLTEPDGSNYREAERRAPWPGTLAEASAVGRDLGAELRRSGAR
ncbi:MAG TPA: hydroxymethylbilane synthase [Polyangiaceae bacterium]|nr:hydroxymethylbilane synthase [Polyangiaceae bacterium]